MIKKTLIAAISSSLIACSTMVPVELPLPARPVLPKVLGVELQCLTQDVYDRLRKRDILKDIHRDKLEAIIGATH